MQTQYKDLMGAWSKGGAPWTQPGAVPGAMMGGGGSSLFGSQVDPMMFMSMAPQGFMGLQEMPGLSGAVGPQPDGSPGIDFNQLAQLMALTSGAPQRIDQFQQQTGQQIARLGQEGHRSIDQQAARMFANQANQLGGQQRMGQQQQGDAMAAMGLAPSIFQSFIRPQQQMDLAGMLGMARGQASAGSAAQHQQLREQQFDRGTGLNQSVLNARNQLEQYYDAMLLQKYLAEIAAKAQMHAAGKSASAQKSGDLLGAAVGILGGIFSDARLKEDVHTLVPGLVRIVSWRWNRIAARLGLFGRGVGVIAQELELVAPERVVEHPSGFKMVLLG